MIRPVNLLLAVSLLGISLSATAQPDAHFADHPAKALFHRSSWAHGYIHGYEAGFHSGNIDLHMARKVRDPHTVKEFKHANRWFRKEFGNRPEFEKGYGSGFEVGYLDGFTGKEFRAASEAQLISEDLTGLGEPDATHSAYFDMMLDSGYVTGRRAGLNDARAKSESASGKTQCPDQVSAPQLCGAYKMGFRWGYTDGYSNQRPDAATQRASK